MTGRHAALADVLAERLGPLRVSTDSLRNAALGGDASAYHLVPRVVVDVASEDDVALVLAEASRRGLPVTFRAAGTSLSGQGVTDSVLVRMRRGFERIEPSGDGATIRLGAAVVGVHANLALAPFRRRIGPDPASLHVACIGGIVANNASGMCCGPGQDTFHTLRGVRAVLADGVVVDTHDAAGRRAFALARPDLLDVLDALARRVRADAPMTAHIRRKHRIKNTTGYSLLALTEHEDPIDIAAHLLVGSEGTLAFVSEVTLATVPDPPHRSCALVVYATLAAACDAAGAFSPEDVAAVEVMDRASLRAVQAKPGVPAGLAALGDDAAALLIEVRAETTEALRECVGATRARIAASAPGEVPDFHRRGTPEYAALWRVRKGLFPAVGAARPAGTAVIIEDVAVPRSRLAACAHDLRAAFAGHGCGDAILFGHALAGNLHFVLTPRLDTPAGIANYEALLEDVVRIVADEHGGSLKAEHGTGRNMAPFVEREWGRAARDVMWEIKRAFDPSGFLNPGVILDDAPDAHLRHLKSLPAVDPALDACIECGFCERACPSRELTFSPRQRIAALRQGARTGVDASAGLSHEIDATCATDGTCAAACPVSIDTGAFVRSRRRATPGMGPVAAHLAVALGASRVALRAARLLPAWSYLPRAASRVRPVQAAGAPDVVHFVSCVNRVLGAAPGDDELALLNVIERLSARAGLRLARPRVGADLCCGLLFESKGRPDLGVAALDRAARALSGTGAPVLVDASPCAARLRESLPEAVGLGRWLLRDVIPRLTLGPLDADVGLHVPCSARDGDEESALRSVVDACGARAITPPGPHCCGMAGDRGLRVPALPASALRGLGDALGPDVACGVSASRACEVALSQHAGRPYRSIAHLVLAASDAASARA